MIDLERSLVELADRLDVPGGDWLVDDVVRRIGEPVRRPAPRRTPRIAAAMAVVIVVVMVALPGPRRAVARWLGFDSVRIDPAPAVTTTTPQPAISSNPSSSTSTTAAVDEPDLGLGSSVSLGEAMASTGLPDPTPALLGDPLSVHVVQPPASGQIVLVYAPSSLLPQSGIIGAGALVSVMPALINEGYFLKTLAATSTVTSVDVAGNPGYWIEGAPHDLLFDFGDQILPDTLRLATNTLLWQRGDDVYRIEADIDLDTALKIAKSVP